MFLSTDEIIESQLAEVFEKQALDLVLNVDSSTDQVEDSFVPSPLKNKKRQ